MAFKGFPGKWGFHQVIQKNKNKNKNNSLLKAPFSLPSPSPDLHSPSPNLPPSQVAPMVKNQPANAGDFRDGGSIPVSGISPGGGHGNPLQYSCLEETHGQRSLAGYSPCGRKGSDKTEAT